MPRSAQYSILIAVALTAACLLCFGRLAIHPTDILVGPQSGGANDLTGYFQPLRVYQLEMWRRYGELPEWDVNLQMGRPTAGNPQASLYYPPNWIYFLTGTERLASWMMVLHHLFAGWGMYLLCRRLKFARPAALLGGVTYVAAPYLVAQTAEGHYPQICVAAWIPWAMLCFERLRLGKRYSMPLMAAVLALAFFCGHVQEVYYLVVVLSAFWIVDLIRQPQDALPRKSLAIHWIGAGALMAGLVAIELGPIWTTSQQTTRQQGERTADVVGGANFENLMQLINPYALGGPVEMLQRKGLYWETLLYVGVVPLLLAVVGVALGWKRYGVLRYGILFLTALLFALGSSTPFYWLLHNFFPGMSTFREPARIMFVASAAVAVVAAGGAHCLLELLQRKLPKAGAIACVGVLCAVVAIELTAHAWNITRTIASDGLRTESELTERFTDSAGKYRVWIDQDLLSDEEAWQHNVAKVRGYDPFTLVRHGAMLQAAIAGERKLQGTEASGFVTDPDLGYRANVMSLIGVRYIAIRQEEGSDPNNIPANWKLLQRGQIPPRVRLRGSSGEDIPYALYENPDALPRAFVVGQTISAERGQQVIEQLQNLDPQHQVILDQDPLPPGDRAVFTPATIVEYSPSRVIIETETEAPGILVLGDTFAAGWKANVNGKPAPILPANIGLRGIPLAAGKHRVELSFTPPMWKASAIMSLLAIAMCIYAAVKTQMNLLNPRSDPPAEE